MMPVYNPVAAEAVLMTCVQPGRLISACAHSSRKRPAWPGV